jgi:hypothetical protein
LPPFNFEFSKTMGRKACELTKTKWGLISRLSSAEAFVFI